jgi:uncharacterized protein (TIGR02271 family)
VVFQSKSHHGTVFLLYAGMEDNENLFPANDNQYNASLPNERSLIIPVIEETLTVDKQVVTTGKIRIEKQVEEVAEPVNIDLQHDEYTIKRVAIDKYIDGEAPQVRQEGNTMIIPVVKEVVVKRLLLVEEVHIIKDVITTNEQLNIPVRKETVTVNRLTDNQESSTQS